MLATCWRPSQNNMHYLPYWLSACYTHSQVHTGAEAHACTYTAKLVSTSSVSRWVNNCTLLKYMKYITCIFCFCFSLTQQRGICICLLIALLIQEALKYHKRSVLSNFIVWKAQRLSVSVYSVCSLDAEYTPSPLMAPRCFGTLVYECIFKMAAKHGAVASLFTR